MKIFRLVLIVTCLALAYTLCLGVRLSIRHNIEEKYGQVSFTMDGAFLYYFSQSIADGKDISKIQNQAQQPEGFNASAEISLTPDYILGFIYRHFFQSISYESFLRIAQPAFLSLSLLIVFGLVFSISGNALGGIWAALLYGLSLASIVRSTGLEYSRENFALPLVFLHFLLQTGKRNIFKNFLAGGVLLLGLIVWDGSQVYFTIFVLFETLRFLIQKEENISLLERLRKHSHLYMHMLWLLPFSFLHPYLKAHFFFFSPAMLGLCAVSLAALFKTKPSKWIFLASVPLGILICFKSGYIHSYDAMIELLWYKIKFLNIKPENPALLPFDVRILWTPTPAAWQNMKSVIFLLPLAVLATVSHVLKRNRDTFFLLFFTWLSSILLLAFVRLEVYLIFFLSCLIGSAPCGFSLQRIKRTIFWNSGIILALLLEAEYITKDFSRFERPVLYSYIEQVVRWVKENTPRRDIVLANFGLSPSFLAYGERGIVLQPKYESKDMREKVKAFAISLFDTNEEAFYKFCLQNKVNYYVHSVGTYKDISPFSWRYMTDQLAPREEALASRFEGIKGLKKFGLLFKNGKYMVYQVITPEDIEKYELFKKEADDFYQKGDWLHSEHKYRQALKHNPNDFMIYFNLAKIYKSSGFPQKAVSMTKEGLKRAQVQNAAVQ
jgi:tetratricopeptide (TPR) repeat protein